MLSKQQYVDSLVHELNVIKHLATKVTPEMLDYRPSEKQRSMMELMQYLGHFISTGFKVYMAGDSNVFFEHAKASESVTRENFIDMIDGQIGFVKEIIPTFSDEDLAKESTVFGFTAPLAVNLLGVLKWAAAYKMQFFLYIKANGVNIGTANVWGGFDMPPKAE